jgi:predicted DNA-binding transcriptional regulator AlpA
LVLSQHIQGVFIVKKPMKQDQLKKMMLMLLQHIKQTNDFINELVPIIEDMEETVPVIVHAPDKYLDILPMDKAVEFTGYSRAYLYKLIYEGVLNRHGQGKVFFKKTELQEFMLRKKKSSNSELAERADNILNGERGGNEQSK